MRLFNFFQKQENREEVIDGNNEDDLLLRAVLSGKNIDRDMAMEIPIVSACCDDVCNAFASIPFKLYKETIGENGKKIVEEVNDPRVGLINDDTHDTLDGFQFKKALCEDYLMGKGGYAYIKKQGNKFVGLYYVKENQISFNWNENPIFKSYDITANGQTFKDFEFLKLLRNTKDGYKGVGLTSQISKSLKTGFKRLQYEYELTATGGSRKGFIKSPRKLDKKSMDELKKAWEEYYSGNANTVILNDGLEFQEASNNSQQNEINSKNITFMSEIKEIFHISSDNTEFIKKAIVPIANAFVKALNRELLLEDEKKEYYFDYDASELLKGTTLERYNAYQIAIKNGWKTRNEIRYLENDNYIPGLDMIELSLGSVLLDANTGNIYTPNTNSTVNIDDSTLVEGSEGE